MGKERDDGQEKYTITIFESNPGDAEKSTTGEEMSKTGEGSDKGFGGLDSGAESFTHKKIDGEGLKGKGEKNEI